ncbi:MAG: DUF58 domain-containing protein [Magnetococcus sp. YQC-9]
MIPPAPSDAAFALDELLALRLAARGVLPAPRRAFSPLEGGHRAPFKGRGMEFADTRPYQAGDEVRHMEWRVTARTGKPHVKLFREERERALLLWLDCRAPMFHATRGRLKITQAARAATLAAWSAIARGDRVGSLLFSEERHMEQRPARGDKAVIAWLRALQGFDVGRPLQATSGEPALAHALSRLERVALPGSMLLLLSDFRGLQPEEHARLAHLARHHELTFFFPHDALERTLPPPGGRYPVALHDGLTNLQDGGRTPSPAEKGYLAVDDPKVRQAYAARFSARHDTLRDLCRTIGARFISCSTEEEATTALLTTLLASAA